MLRFCGALVMLLAVTTSAQDLGTYRVALDANLRRLDVEACFVKIAEQRSLAAASERISSGIRDLVWQQGERQLRLRLRNSAVQAPSTTGCLRYGVLLDRLVQPGRFSDVARVGRDWMTTPDAWLLQPSLIANESLHIEFILPAGISVSAPWLPLDESWLRYRIKVSPKGSWRPIVAFGRFKNEIIAVGKSRLRMAVMDSQPAADIATTRRWMQNTASHVLNVYGRFPEPEVQVVLNPMIGDERLEAQRRMWGSRRSVPAVGFARILRAGGAAAQFQFNQTVSLDQLMQDWTATHEFSHLLLPFLDDGGSWISEGFASYYQNLLLARGGVYSEQEAWNELHAGLMRGRGDGRYRTSLRESMEEGGNNALMRRYWTGAAVALMADVDLRARSGNRESLDTLLDRLGACCVPSNNSWRVAELFAKLDSFAGRAVLAPMIERFYEAADYPDLAPLYSRLGIEVIDDERVRLLQQAPLLEVRQALMASPSVAAD